MAEHPSGSIKETFTEAKDCKAVYRFLNSEAFDTEALETAQRQACLERCAAYDFILTVQDTTELTFSSSPALQEAEDRLWVHSALAVSPAGVPLGLLHQQRWTRPADQPPSRHRRRERPFEDKESYRWLESRQAVEKLVPAEQTVLMVADREADIFELFAAPRPDNSELLIRATRNRRVASPERRLWETLQATPCAGQMQVPVRRQPQRPARLARLEVRFCELELQPSTYGRPPTQRPPVRVTAIWVREVGGPPQAPPVDWMLLTTLPVTRLAEACRCVQYYTWRWLVERYHYVLKSGCKLQDSQLRTQRALERLTVLYSAVAWRLLWLTYEARRDSTQPCTVAFTTAEWQTLLRLHAGRTVALPEAPPPLGEVVRRLARLGGHPGRRGDSEPGVKVLWRGLTRLQDILLVFAYWQVRRPRGHLTPCPLSQRGALGRGGSEGTQRNMQGSVIGFELATSPGVLGNA
jgi:hypothetical protein